MKMLRYTDRDSILCASKKSPVKEDGKDISFAVDYSVFTINRRRSFMEVTNKSQKMGFQTFLMYPTQLKLTWGSAQHIFKSPLEVEDFLSSLATQELWERVKSDITYNAFVKVFFLVPLFYLSF